MMMAKERFWHEEKIMRLRNIPRADSVISAHPLTINTPKEYKGSWQNVFGNKNPVHIEIGMGKGQFLMQKAALHPENNYIGIERYSSVLLRAVERYDLLAAQKGAAAEAGCHRDAEEPAGVFKQGGFTKLCNIRFICMDANDLPLVFEKGEVDKIYLNFSDPWPKARHARRRLTSREFLTVYEQVLKKGGIVEFKTDNTGLFDFTLEQMRKSGWETKAFTYDLHHDKALNEGNIMTEYEEKFSAKGNAVCKGIFTFPGK